MVTFSSAERAKRLALFVVLVLCTLLHVISVWPVYGKALDGIWSFLPGP